MKSTRSRLDRFLRRHINASPREVRLLLVNKRVKVDELIATEMNQVIHQFSKISIDNDIIQHNLPRYIMLNKPKGVVSATKDKQHTTVVDLLDTPNKEELHIVGRLDFNTSGLVLLTNDGNWSRRLSSPENRIQKKYHVTVENPLEERYIHQFSKGIYFPYEGITTQSAQLKIIDTHTAELSLVEGRYHQVKRMFGYFQNRVTKLHRFAVGNLILDPTLRSGESKTLTDEEANTIFDK